MDLYVVKVFDGRIWNPIYPTSTFVFDLAMRSLKCIRYQYRHLPKEHVKIGKIGGMSEAERLSNEKTCSVLFRNSDR